MKTFVCTCNNTIFYENTRCIVCGSELGWCPCCERMTALLPENDELYRCGNSECNSLLSKCKNYSLEMVCNRCFAASSDVRRAEGLCDYCDFNATIPDLTVSGNREMWKRLEEAKRRLLYTLDLLRLPYGKKTDGLQKRLRFDFKADPIDDANQWWWSLGKEERVYTGHSGGKITINLREADTVEREKARVLVWQEIRSCLGSDGSREWIAHFL